MAFNSKLLTVKIVSFTCMIITKKQKFKAAPIAPLYWVQINQLYKFMTAKTVKC